MTSPCYREDGWPLCPECGQDELWTPKIPPHAEDDLSCYNCGWSGKVPPRVDIALSIHAKQDPQ